MTEKTTKAFASHAKDAQWDKGLRPYFVYRDLGIKDATEGKVMAHVIRADQSCEGPMGYHSHALDFQMNYLLKGCEIPAPDFTSCLAVSMLPDCVPGSISRRITA